MATEYEPLALIFAPELYYVDTDDSFGNIAPRDMGGLYWRAVESTVSWADVCIQYIIYFRQQQWVPSILDRFSGKLPGSHPNDYAPIFLYLKNGKPVRIVFDICHYEAVGAVNTPSVLLPPDGKPKFQVKNFYRGLLPLKTGKGYTPLGGAPIRLTQERLDEWRKGFIFDGSYNEKAKLIIKEKLENPFKRITTFRDRAGKLGFLFHWIFRSTKEYQARGLPADVDAMTSNMEEGMGDKAKYFVREDIEEVTGFANQNILEKSRIPEYLALRKSKFQKV
ncbi:MAG: hypothetical protein AYK19_06975 [Theionarchaea archaeon DG-70-1]|nr:MAG: hypothetical protein AYK19_06975 [Theionarchaea archaeon DG-70-1]